MIVHPHEFSILLIHVKLVYLYIWKFGVWHKFASNIYSANIWRPLMIKKLIYDHTKITMLIANPMEMKIRVIGKYSYSNLSVIWFQNLKAVMHLLLHWTKLAGNLASKADTIVNGKRSWFMCLAMPHPTWG